jgi:hypothetical protein
MSAWKIGLVAGLATVILLVATTVVHAEGTNEEEAVAVARTWLALVDGGEYAQSWESAAKLFRNAVSREQWESVSSGAREPLGSLVSRELKSASYQTSLPGAPDGEYVVIEFDSVFEKKATAVELVTPMKDPDGKWRVSGYFIR